MDMIVRVCWLCCGRAMSTGARFQLLAAAPPAQTPICDVWRAVSCASRTPRLRIGRMISIFLLRGDKKSTEGQGAVTGIKPRHYAI